MEIRNSAIAIYQQKPAMSNVDAHGKHRENEEQARACTHTIAFEG